MEEYLGKRLDTRGYSLVVGSVVSEKKDLRPI